MLSSYGRLSFSGGGWCGVRVHVCVVSAVLDDGDDLRV